MPSYDSHGYSDSIGSSHSHGESVSPSFNEGIFRSRSTCISDWSSSNDRSAGRSYHGDPTSISQQRLRDVFDVFLNMLLDCGALADFAASGWSREERIHLLRRMFLSALQ
jgi:hypothetical protein